MQSESLLTSKDDEKTAEPIILFITLMKCPSTPYLVLFSASCRFSNEVHFCMALSNLSNIKENLYQTSYLTLKLSDFLVVKMHERS